MKPIPTGPTLGIFRHGVEDRELVTLRHLTEFGVKSFVATTKGGMPYEATGLGLDVVTLREPFERLPVSARMKALARKKFSSPRQAAIRGIDGALARSTVVNVSEAFNVLSAQVVARAARLRTPSIVTVYENIAYRYDDDPRMAARKDAVYSVASAFVAVTPGAVDALIDEGVPPGRIHLIPYGVAVGAFDSVVPSSSMRRSWGAVESTVIFIYTGRLLREKGLVELVRALRGIESTDWKLVLVGHGTEESRIRRVAHQCGLAGNLVFTGWVPTDRVREMLCSADVFVCPSLETPYWKEQLGFSTLEAMAAGLPVVATATGSFPYLLGAKASDLLATPYCVQDLTRALISAMDSGRREVVGQRNRRAAEGEFSAEASARSYFELICALIRR